MKYRTRTKLLSLEEAVCLCWLIKLDSAHADGEGSQLGGRRFPLKMSLFESHSAGKESIKAQKIKRKRMKLQHNYYIKRRKRLFLDEIEILRNYLRFRISRGKRNIKAEK